MDMEPFCMSKDVRDMRTAITGRDYDWGLDVNPAMQLCKLVFWEPRNV